MVIPLKIFTQELCVVKLDWDQPLTEQPLENWRQLSSSLREPSPIMIPRCFLEGIAEQIISYRLCGFSDASLKAYAAVVYLLVETPSGCQIRITASKTRVSPLKTLTIPRLELLSALLLARLMNSITQALEEVSLSEPHCFSDSTVTVFWIRARRGSRSSRIEFRGVKSTLTELRSQFWIVRGRSFNCPTASKELCTLQEIRGSSILSASSSFLAEVSCE